MIREGTPLDIPALAQLQAVWVAEAGGDTAVDPHFPDAFRA